MRGAHLLVVASLATGCSNDESRESPDATLSLRWAGVYRIPGNDWDTRIRLEMPWEGILETTTPWGDGSHQVGCDLVWAADDRSAVLHAAQECTIPGYSLRKLPQRVRYTGGALTIVSDGIGWLATGIDLDTGAGINESFLLTRL